MSSGEFTNAHPALAQFWHPVALSCDVGEEPVAARLAGQGWALARLGGAVAAFADACPHRRARLSAGQLTDGTLQCPYTDGDQCNCTNSKWNCFTAGCPTTKPTPSASCGSVFGQCTYGTGAGSACVCVAGAWFCN